MVHYDLSWNPTRHEQRDGRVDRFGQPRKEIRILTYYGTDNQIDGIVLDVLLRKHQKIRNALGVSVPMPGGQRASRQKRSSRDCSCAARARRPLTACSPASMTTSVRRSSSFTTIGKPSLIARNARAPCSPKSRSRFDEVSSELAESERAIGSPAELSTFFRSTLTLSGAVVNDDAVLKTDLAGIKPARARGTRRGAGESPGRIRAVSAKEVTLLHRTHTLVEGLATYVLNSALDPLLGGIARRAGVVRSKAVKTRTVLLLLRLRFHIVHITRDGERHLLAEMRCSTHSPVTQLRHNGCPRLTPRRLIALKPDASVPPDIAIQQLEGVTSHLANLAPTLDASARARGQQLLEAHRRVRSGGRREGELPHRP